MSLTDTIRREPTFLFLTEKLKAGSNYTPELTSLLDLTGFSHLEYRYRDVEDKTGSEQKAIISFMVEILGLTEMEAIKAYNPATPEETSKLYRNLYEGKREGE